MSNFCKDCIHYLKTTQTVENADGSNFDQQTYQVLENPQDSGEKEEVARCSNDATSNAIIAISAAMDWLFDDQQDDYQETYNKLLNLDDLVITTENSTCPNFTAS